MLRYILGPGCQYSAVRLSAGDTMTATMNGELFEFTCSGLDHIGAFARHRADRSVVSKRSPNRPWTFGFGLC